MTFPREEIEQSIVDRFELQVRRHAERLALRTRTHTLTYGQLNAWANQIGRAILNARGEGSEPVALLLDQGPLLLASILGVLKAGKAYVPLDPAYPPARNADILQEAQAALILTDSVHAAAARDWTSGAASLLDAAEVPARGSTDNLGLAVPPDALAWILYTSGSTGHPKGVMQIHRNVLHNAWKYTHCAELSADDRLTLLASCSFAASVTDIFGAWLNGASLHPFRVPDEGLGRLADWLVQEKITVYHSVPSLFRQFAGTLTGDRSGATPGTFPHLRLIKLGGEPILRADVEQYRRHFPAGCRLFAGMGCTELNIVRRLFIDPATPLDAGAVPVGYAVPDTEVLLLDEAGEPVEAGGVGEISIKSRYLSPGYWRRPELTAASFQDCPDGDRLYRTGDMGRFLPDGCLVHLGRRDEQVKIRGFRVEVAEVEAALLDHPGIQEAAVVARERGEGDLQLVAYLVARGAPQPSADELRRFLLQKLPDYMAPALFQFLEALPTTPTGKVDRRSLPAPDPPRPSRAGPASEARTPREEQLCRIWEEVLEVAPVGVEDSFFDLGGHSLLAARMLLRVEQLSGRFLPPAALLQAPTIRQLAALLDPERPAPRASSLVPLQPEGTRPPLFLVHGIGGNVLGYRVLARCLGPDQPVYGLQAVGLDGEQACHTRVEEMAAHYLREVRAWAPHGPYLLGGASFGGRVAFEMAQQLLAQGERVALLALFDSPARSSARTWTWRQRLRAHAGALRGMGPRGQLAYLMLRARRRGQREVALAAHGALQRAGLRLPQTLRTVEQFNRQASRAYQPRVYAGPLTLFPARQRSEGWDDPRLGWTEFAAGGLEVVEAPGDHVTMLEEPHAPVLAGLLRSCLDRALSVWDDDLMT